MRAPPWCCVPVTTRNSPSPPTSYEKRASFVATYACDLSDPDDIAKLFARIRREIGSVDVLINNAGIINVGPVETMNIDDYQQAMAVHFWHRSYALSMSCPTCAAAAKAALSISLQSAARSACPIWSRTVQANSHSTACRKAMRAELAKDGIYVTTVCPGLMRTGSPRNALFKGQHRARIRVVQHCRIDAARLDERRSSGRSDHSCLPLRSRQDHALPSGKLAVIANTLAPPS